MSQKEGGDSPWQKGTRVKGVVPPGRRLSDAPRKTRWSASGVSGVTPPGTLGPDEGPSADWAAKVEKERADKVKANRRALDRAKAKPGNASEVDPMRPIGGFAPDVFADLHDPSDMKTFLRKINELLEQLKPTSERAEGLASLITQSRAPFEIVVGFTILSAVIGKSTQLRRRHAFALERGAKTFFNLLGRLERDVQVPRGLVPETVDALFYDLPQAAYQIPYAYATDAFVRMIELLRDHDEDTDRALIGHAQTLYQSFIASRSLGDHPLTKMFPFELPEWASFE